MNKSATIVFLAKTWGWLSLMAIIALPSTLIQPLQAGELPALTLRTESFDNDPGWEGRFNRVNYHPAQQIRQDYAFQAGSGEIGGEVWRSTSQASWYAKVLPQLTLQDSLRIDGRFRVTQMDLPVDVSGTLSGFHNASDYFLGFFNSERQGWRPQNWLGMRLRALRLPGVNGSALVESTYTTKTWRTGPEPVGASGDVLVEPNNQWHNFSIDYNPAGNSGGGTLRLTMDGVTRLGNLFPNHKMEGAVFNRFGIRSNQVPGRQMTAFFDDLTLTINGQAMTDTFDSDPQWEGHNNRAKYLEQVQYGENDFGFRMTDYAGGNQGEAGGRFWNVNPTPTNLHGRYGDPDIGTLNLDTPLHASGKISLQKFDTDGSVLIGYYNSKKLGSPPENFMGVVIDGPSQAGRWFWPMYGNAGGAGERGRTDNPQSPPLAIEPYSQHDWSFDYDPAANGGIGAITVTLGDKKWVLNLTRAHRLGGATFDRFGMLNEQRANGNSAEVFIDDVTYTVAVIPEPAGAVHLGLAILVLAAARRRRSGVLSRS